MTREDKLWSMRLTDLKELAEKYGISTSLSQDDLVGAILKVEQPKSELELFAKQTLDQGGEWYKLEEGLYESKSKHLIDNSYIYDTPVYQVFNSEGKRVFSTVSYTLAYNFWRNMPTS
jgi:hypothetical protein